MVNSKIYRLGFKFDLEKTSGLVAIPDGLTFEQARAAIHRIFRKTYPNSRDWKILTKHEVPNLIRYNIRNYPKLDLKLHLDDLEKHGFTEISSEDAFRKQLYRAFRKLHPDKTLMFERSRRTQSRQHIVDDAVVEVHVKDRRRRQYHKPNPPKPPQPKTPRIHLLQPLLPPRSHLSLPKHHYSSRAACYGAVIRFLKDPTRNARVSVTETETTYEIHT